MMWHKFPEETPPEATSYLVTVKYGKGAPALEGASVVWMMHWIGFGWIDPDGYSFESNEAHRVVAWMEEPDPYYEDEE